MVLHELLLADKSADQLGLVGIERLFVLADKGNNHFAVKALQREASKGNQTGQQNPDRGATKNTLSIPLTDNVFGCWATMLHTAGFLNHTVDAVLSKVPSCF